MWQRLVWSMLLGCVAPHLGAEASVVCDLVIPDAQALCVHLRASPYGSMAHSAMVAVVRQGMNAYLEQQSANLGCDLHALIADATALRVQVLCERAPAGFGYRLGVACPTQAALSWGEMLHHAASPPPLEWGPWLISQDGAWLCAGRGVQPVLPPAPRPRGAPGDIIVHADLEHCCSALMLGPCAQAARLLGLGAISGSLTFTPEGTRDSASLPSLQLPVVALDLPALTQLPRSACVVWAVGIDGARLSTLLTQLAVRDPVFNELLSTTKAEFLSACSHELMPLVQSLSGTVAIAVSTGMPSPGLTVMIPRNATIDEALTTLATEDTPSALAGGIGALIPAQVVIEVRRTRSHWIITTDPTIANADDSQPPLMDLGSAAQGLSGPGEQPVMMAWQDNRHLLTYLGSALPILRTTMQESQPEQPAWMPSERALNFLEQAAATVGPAVPPSLTLLMQDASGVHLSSRNGIAQGGILGVMLMACAPVILQWQESEREARMASWEQTLAGQCVTYATTHGGNFPPTLRQLPRTHGADVDALLQAPDTPRPGSGYLYVRPCANCGEAKLPLIVEDPACCNGKGSEVAYVDGHVEFQTGTALWTTALRLSKLPDILTCGIAPGLWGLTSSTQAADTSPAKSETPTLSP